MCVMYSRVRSGEEGGKKGAFPPKIMSFANPHAASSVGVAPKRSAGEEGHEGKGLWEVGLLLLSKSPQRVVVVSRRHSALCERFHRAAGLKLFYLLFQREVKSR